MMEILIADLHEDRAAVGEEVAGDGQPVAQRVVLGEGRVRLEKRGLSVFTLWSD